MTYKATVYRVMIASPSDVPEERQIIEDAVYRWNTIHSVARETVLLPVRWETHSIPAMGKRGQAHINEQMLANSDILIAVFWTRFGTPTGVAPSGTVEEIQAHIAAQKPAMVYFSSKPIDPNKLDYDQHRAVNEFRAWCEKNGLYDTYATLEAFREKVERQLAAHMNTETPNTTILPGPEPVLSEAAQTILFSMCDHETGSLMAVPTASGRHISTVQRDFSQGESPRNQAKWWSAVQELDREDFVAAQDGNQETFAATDKGWTFVELNRVVTPLD